MFNGKKSDAALAMSHHNINTLIGEGCTFKGDLHAKHSIKIDGHIQGNLLADGCVILGEKSLIQGDIQCAELIVFGRLDGNVQARQLHLKSSAQIHGNIQTQTLHVEPGAIYQGSVTMKSPQASPAAGKDEAHPPSATV